MKSRPGSEQRDTATMAARRPKGQPAEGRRVQLSMSEQDAKEIDELLNYLGLHEWPDDRRTLSRAGVVRWAVREALEHRGIRSAKIKRKRLARKGA